MPRPPVPGSDPHWVRPRWAEEVSGRGSSSQSQRFPFPAWDQSEPAPSLAGALCLFPDFLTAHILLLAPWASLPTTPSPHPAGSGGEGADLPAQMVTPGQLLAPPAGGSLARPEIPIKPDPVAAGGPQGPMGAGVSLFFECPPKLEKAVLSQLCPLPSLSEKKTHFFSNYE